MAYYKEVDAAGSRFGDPDPGVPRPSVYIVVRQSPGAVDRRLTPYPGALPVQEAAPGDGRCSKVFSTLLSKVGLIYLRL